MCILGFHKWGKWKTVQGGHVKNREGVVIGFYVTQEKRCSKCGVSELREVKS